jgi:hypothetical protein
MAAQRKPTGDRPTTTKQYALPLQAAPSADVLRSLDIARIARVNVPAGLFISATDIGRLHSQIDKSKGANGPWKWKGATSNGNGYPQYTYKRQDTGRKDCANVHRLLMAVHVGRRLESWEHVCHQPGTESWDVNPANCRIDTHQSNMNDAKAAGANFGRKLKADDVREITRLHATGLKAPVIAKQFNVNTSTVARILSGRTHSKVTGYVYAPKRRLVS